MQNAVDIMAMVQKASMVKQKFDVPGKNLGVERGSFKKELFEARKDILSVNNGNSRATKNTTRSTTENTAEKVAKVMSSSNSKAEVKEDKPIESLEQTKQAEQTDKDNNVIKESKPEVENIVSSAEDTQEEDDVKTVLEMLEQLLQQLKIVQTAGAENNENSEAVTTLEGISQSLKQVQTKPIANQAEEISDQLKVFAVELNKLVQQLPKAAKQEDGAQQSTQAIMQLIEKLSVEIPQLEQKLQKVNVDNEDLQVATNSKASIKELSNNTTATSEAKLGEQPAQIDTNASDKPDNEDKKDNKQKNEKDTGQKAEAGSETKQTYTVDKSQPQLQQVVDNTLPLAEQQKAEINIKNSSSDLQKNNLVQISKSDIINQVVKKADIRVSEGHQEMIMKLEPESLGKLNLKISVENGLVTAKFVAESQQIKEVLESSFNQLKDALQQKGINVQGLSVSVGQQGGEFNSNQSFNQWKHSIKTNNKVSGEYMELDDEMNSSLNPYSYHEGKIDYRA